MKLSNKKSLVTGASRGIGKAIALQLASEGCTVGVHYRDREDEAKAVVAEIEKQGGKAYLFQADLAHTEGVIAMGTNAWETMSGIDFLINNAGISYKKHFLDYSIDDINQFTDINFKGTLFLTQTIARLMVASNTEGSIYTITSVNGIRPGLGLSAYGATKGALETLMKGVAMEMAPHHIKVNTLALGAVETDMTAGVINDPSLLKEVNEGIPMGRFGHADEIAHVLVDLLSSGSYITGSSITIDGGLLLMRGYGKNKQYKI
jgi:NAD(P)-dependent dehydrogenase (short-subunit alcohol dehydrogenase family)